MSGDIPFLSYLQQTRQYVSILTRHSFKYSLKINALFREWELLNPVMQEVHYGPKNHISETIADYQ
jgi:hypothetical protein